jgi:DNA-binding Lrp family transcriptional regulator
MGRQAHAEPLPRIAFIRKSFAIRDGVIVRLRTSEPTLFERGPSDHLLVRVMVEGRIRRIAAPRLAWALASGEWPHSTVKLRDDHAGYGAENLVLLRRGQNPFAVGKASLIRRAERDVALLKAVAENPDATLPVLSRHVGSSASCVCVRLGKLADHGLCEGPKCDPRVRWQLTPARRELAARSQPPLDDTDLDILRAVARGPRTSITLAAAIASVGAGTASRRLKMLKAAGLVSNGDRYSLTDAGRAALGDEPAPKREPWVKVAAISAASARDVRERRNDDLPSWERSRRISEAIHRGRETAKANKTVPFNAVVIAAE